MASPVWVYWEGLQPDYIALALRTIATHCPGYTLLDRRAFEAMRAHDVDIDIDRLSPNHRSDYVRAYLLAHHGGLYVDADCILLRDLAAVAAMADVQGFVGYREPQGYMSCNFMAARAGGAVIADHYRRVCERLRRGGALQWLDLASTPMDAAVAAHGAGALLLPTASVMPVPWNESARFAARRTDAAHARHFHADAWCYMLSNNTIRSLDQTRVLTYMPAEHLLADRYFLSYVLRRALGLPPIDPPAGADGDGERLFETADHLGGHEDKTQFDEGAFDYLAERFQVKRFLDVGCGQPGMVYYARRRAITAIGVDGDPNYARGSPVILEHDYATGPLDAGDFDLGWAVEFVEHVDEQHVPNFMATFSRCRRVFITAAVPGQPGHHHVNCQSGEYWIARFAEHGFRLDQAATRGVREHSTMWSKFTSQTGLVFERSL